MNRVYKALQLHGWGIGRLYNIGLLLGSIRIFSFYSANSFGQTYLFSDEGTFYYNMVY